MLFEHDPNHIESVTFDLLDLVSMKGQDSQVFQILKFLDFRHLMNEIAMEIKRFQMREIEDLLVNSSQVII